MTPQAIKETTFPGIIQHGQTSDTVRTVQEWLCLHGHKVDTDREFGTVETEPAVKAFQKEKGLPETGVVDEATWSALVAPMVAALAPIREWTGTYGDLVVAIARQHLTQKPRESGGENCGPWVRLYMNGYEGTQWPWCAGFATFILREASRALSISVPHPYVFGCDDLAVRAKAAGTFMHPTGPADVAKIRPGYLFLVPRGDKPGFYQHIGIVAAVNGKTLVTIEGNSNTDGSNNGTEVVEHSRNALRMDYLVV